MHLCRHEGNHFEGKIEHREYREDEPFSPTSNVEYPLRSSNITYIHASTPKCGVVLKYHREPLKSSVHPRESAEKHEEASLCSAQTGPEKAIEH